MLFRFSKIRVIVNGKDIYQVVKERPTIISAVSDRSTIVITDGFHYTHPLQISNKKSRALELKIQCALDDNRLFAAAIVTSILFLAGLTSEASFIQFVAFLPTIYFLYSYYGDKAGFIKVQALSL